MKKLCHGLVLVSMLAFTFHAGQVSACEHDPHGKKEMTEADCHKAKCNRKSCKHAKHKNPAGDKAPVEKS
jgi:hypothetical protein